MWLVTVDAENAKDAKNALTIALLQYSRWRTERQTLIRQTCARVVKSL